MTVARMAAANYYTVGSSLKCTQNKHGIYSARTGDTDNFNVSGIRKSVVAGEVGTRVGAPVTAKSQYQRFIVVYLHIASTSAIICEFAKPLKSIAPEGHATVQAPQPWQTAGLTLATRLVFVVLSGMRKSLLMYVIAP